jgi:hypothetical protein
MGFRPPRIWAQHFAAGRSLIHDVPESDATIDFVLLPLGRIDGTVHGLKRRSGRVRLERADEPSFARVAVTDKAGKFQVTGVPTGEYLVTVDGPASAQITATRISVVANETTNATVSIESPSIRLRVKVPHGRAKDLVIEPMSNGAAVTGIVMQTQDGCEFDFVEPGTYRVSLDGATWTSIDVAPSPEEQVIDLRALG